MVIGENESFDSVFGNESEDDSGVIETRLVDEGRRNPKSSSKFTSKVATDKSLWVGLT